MGARFIILPTCRVCVKFLLFSVALACDAHHSKGKQCLLMALPPALCLEAWHINSAHAPLNRDDGGLLPDAYLHLVRKKAVII